MPCIRGASQPAGFSLMQEFADKLLVVPQIPTKYIFQTRLSSKRSNFLTSPYEVSGYDNARVHCRLLLLYMAYTIETQAHLGKFGKLVLSTTGSPRVLVTLAPSCNSNFYPTYRRSKIMRPQTTGSDSDVTICWKSVAAGFMCLTQILGRYVAGQTWLTVFIEMRIC